MEVKLVQVENDIDYKEFKLCNENNEQIVNFDVEISKETALISYDTKEEFRHQGYASRGLKLVRDTLFGDDDILFLELINLSGDYSRKVAENAGFFSRSGNLDYWVLSNPRAEEIINNRLNSLDASSSELSKTNRLLKKVQSWQYGATKAKEKLYNKLEQFLEQRDLLELEGGGKEDYKIYLESEIHHLEGILSPPQDVVKKAK